MANDDSLGRKILRAFVKPDEPDEPVSVSPVSVSPVVSTPLGQPDSTASNALTEQVKALVMSSSTDFTTVLNTANRLVGIIDDPVKRIQAAAASSNITMASMLIAIKTHHEMLDKINKQTQADSKKFFDERVTQMELNASHKEQSVVQLQKQIDDLEKLKTATSLEVVQFRESAELAKTDIAIQQSNADTAVAAVRHFINSTQEQMASAIK